MEKTERTSRPSHIPDQKWDACVQKSSIIMGACTLAGTVISSLFGNTAGAMYGAGLGAAWSLRKCRAMFKEDDGSLEGDNKLAARSNKPVNDANEMKQPAEMNEDCEGDDEKSQDYDDDKSQDCDDDKSQDYDDDKSQDGADDKSQDYDDDKSQNCDSEIISGEEENESCQEEDDETYQNSISMDAESEDKSEEQHVSQECIEVEATENCDENDDDCDQVIVLTPEDICEDDETEEGDECENQTFGEAEKMPATEVCSNTENGEKLTQEIWWISKTEDNSSGDDVCTCGATTKVPQKESEFKLSPISSIIPKPYKENHKEDTQCEDVCTCDECNCDTEL